MVTLLGKECIHATNIIVKYFPIAIVDHRLVDWYFTIFVNNSNVSAIVDRRIIRGLSIDASYQISDHLAMRLQRRFLEIDQSETRIACGGHVC
jgi:hypothetical protein